MDKRPTLARVLFWGCYDKGKPRTRILIAGLRARGIVVDEVHAPVWEGIDDKSQVQGRLTKARLALRWLTSYPRLLWRLSLAPRPDVVVVGYPGLLDALFAWPIVRLRRLPLVWDVFISLYDTVVMDRGLVSPGSLAARLLFGLERLALRSADTVCMDTAAHARRLETLFGLPNNACRRVWVGVERSKFPRHLAEKTSRPARTGHMTVLFYGQFIPLHGIDTIVRAARLLRDMPIDWILIGKGQEKTRIDTMLDDDPLSHVRRIEWVPYAELQDWIARADLCLGIFGTSEKAACVIPNKVFQIVAAGRPLVTGDSPAIRELLSHAPPCTYLVPMGDAEALAAALLEHRNWIDEGKLVGTSCHDKAILSIDESAIGAQFVVVLQDTLVKYGR